jgi:hypothetical protein
MNLLVQFRHKPLTEWITACYDSGAFSEKFLRALFFCSAPKMLKAPSGDGAFLVSGAPHFEKPMGQEYFRGIGLVPVGNFSVFTDSKTTARDAPRPGGT